MEINDDVSKIFRLCLEETFKDADVTDELVQKFAEMSLLCSVLGQMEEQPLIKTCNAMLEYCAKLNAEIEKEETEEESLSGTETSAANSTEPEKRLGGGKYGMNTQYYEKLLQLYPLNRLHPGRRLLLKDLATQLSFQVTDNRFISIISGWRRILEKEGIIVKKEKDELIVLDNKEKIKKSLDKYKS